MVCIISLHLRLLLMNMKFFFLNIFKTKCNSVRERAFFTWWVGWWLGGIKINFGKFPKGSSFFLRMASLQTQIQIEGGGLVQDVTKSITNLLNFVTVKQKLCQLNWQKMELIHNIYVYGFWKKRWKIKHPKTEPSFPLFFYKKLKLMFWQICQ